jgi:hypothetical protein
LTEQRQRLEEVKRRGAMTLDPLLVPPLLVHQPDPNAGWHFSEPANLSAYLRKHGGTQWLGPVVKVYETFFADRPPGGYFIEAGGLDGSIRTSNSYLFERYLGWQGLMVEANPLNFATLVSERRGAYRTETALCPRVGNVSFASGSCCSHVAGKTARHLGLGLRDGRWGDSHTRPRSSAEYLVRCTPLGMLLRAMDVKRVDFFILDVESSEYAVLAGMDWTIPISVLMIENCKGSSPELLRSHGFVRARSAEFDGARGEGCGHMREPDCPRDQVWFHPQRARPRHPKIQFGRRHLHTLGVE